MKKVKKAKKEILTGDPDIDGMPSELDFEKLGPGIRGKHYKKFREGTNLAKLDSDVRAAFPTDEAVNNALRSLIQSGAH